MQGEVTAGGFAGCGDGGELRIEVGEYGVEGGGEGFGVEPGPEGGDVVEDGGAGDLWEEAVCGGDEEGWGGEGERREPGRAISVLAEGIRWKRQTIGIGMTDPGLFR